MASRRLRTTDNGGVEITLTDNSGTERELVLEPSDSGDLMLTVRGPDGEKSGIIDPEAY